MCVCVCVCVCVCGEMEDFGKSDEMIKINVKVNKLNTYNGFSSNISFFIQGRSSNCFIVSV